MQTGRENRLNHQTDLRNVRCPTPIVLKLVYGCIGGCGIVEFVGWCVGPHNKSPERLAPGPVVCGLKLQCIANATLSKCNCKSQNSKKHQLTQIFVNVPGNARNVVAYLTAVQVGVYDHVRVVPLLSAVLAPYRQKPPKTYENTIFSRQEKTRKPRKC